MGRRLRKIRTRQERSANKLHDKEGVWVRGGRRLLPNAWDDIPHGRMGRGWKDQTKARKS